MEVSGETLHMTHVNISVHHITSTQIHDSTIITIRSHILHTCTRSTHTTHIHKAHTLHTCTRSTHATHMHMKHTHYTHAHEAHTHTYMVSHTNNIFKRKAHTCKHLDTPIPSPQHNLQGPCVLTQLNVN